MQAVASCAVAARVAAPARVTTARRAATLSSRVQSKALKAGYVDDVTHLPPPPKRKKKTNNKIPAKEIVFFFCSVAFLFDPQPHPRSPGVAVGKVMEREGGLWSSSMGGEGFGSTDGDDCHTPSLLLHRNGLGDHKKK